MKVSPLLFIFGAACLVTACSHDYVISTPDGHMMAAHGKPVKDKDTGLISYRDADGNIHQLHQSDVKEISEK